MSKLMTLYVLFDSLERDIISLTDKFPVSKNAYQKEGSTIYAELGTDFRLKDILELFSKKPELLEITNGIEIKYKKHWDTNLTDISIKDN